MGEIKYVASLVMLSLFVIAIIGYATNFGIDNASGVRIDSTDSSYNTLNSSIRSNMDEFVIVTNDSSSGFFKGSIPQSSGSTDGTSVTGGEFKVGVKPLRDSMKNIFLSINKNIFGNNPAFAIFLNALFGFLVFLGIRYIWKTWKGGNPN